MEWNVIRVSRRRMRRLNRVWAFQDIAHAQTRHRRENPGHCACAKYTGVGTSGNDADVGGGEPMPMIASQHPPMRAFALFPLPRMVPTAESMSYFYIRCAHR